MKCNYQAVLLTNLHMMKCKTIMVRVAIGTTLYVIHKADEQLEQATGKDVGDWVQHGVGKTVEWLV